MKQKRALQRAFFHVFLPRPIPESLSGDTGGRRFLFALALESGIQTRHKARGENAMTAVEMIVAQAQHEMEATYQDGSYHVYAADAGDIIEK